MRVAHPARGLLVARLSYATVSALRSMSGSGEQRLQRAVGLAQLGERRRQRLLAECDREALTADGPEQLQGGVRGERCELLACPGEEEAAGTLAEQPGQRQGALAEGDRRAEPAGQAALGERDGEPALADVVGATEAPGAHGLADRVLRGQRLTEVERREALAERLAAQLGELAAAERGDVRRAPAEQRDRVAGAQEPETPGACGVGQSPDHPDHGGRIDRTAGALVVEADVAADDRCL